MLKKAIAIAFLAAIALVPAVIVAVWHRMGAVWVNGHNLGRFWDRGGQRSLFLPSHWLKAGQNEVVVLELHDAPKTAEITGGTRIIEERATPFAVRLDRE